MIDPHHALVRLTRVMSSSAEPLWRWIHEQVVYRGVVTARGEGRVFRYIRDLESAQHTAPPSVHDRQAVRLARILSVAGSRCPYYRTRWGDRLPVGPGSAFDVLRQLPLLGKSDLQGAADTLAASPPPRRTTRKTTGGSTGQAVTILKDSDALAREMAATWLAYGWFGVRPGDKSARFWGVPQTVRRRLRAAAVRVAVRRINFSAFAFDDEDLERYWKRCLQYRPAFFYGYVSMLEAFADFVKRRGYDGRLLGLKSVVTTSEVLAAPQRRLLEEVFGAPVQNEYGCGEVGPIAYECERGGLHVIAENLVVELLRPDGGTAGEGESGEIVVTDLNNRAMPLIRYRLQDFGVRGRPCPCGRGWPTLERIWGRAYDFVQTPDGRRYHGEFFMYMLEDLRDAGRGVSQVQVTQVSSHRVDVAVVTPGPLDDAVARRVAGIVRDRLPGMEVTVQSVASIPRTASGKLRLIRNLWLNPDAT